MSPLSWKEIRSVFLTLGRKFPNFISTMLQPSKFTVKTQNRLPVDKKTRYHTMIFYKFIAFHVVVPETTTWIYTLATLLSDKESWRTPGRGKKENSTLFSVSRSLCILVSKNSQAQAGKACVRRSFRSQPAPARSGSNPFPFRPPSSARHPLRLLPRPAPRWRLRATSPAMFS